jgi:hypothetical protein
MPPAGTLSLPLIQVHAPKPGLCVPVTVTDVEPDLDESCAEVAVIVAVPVVAGVKMPVLLTEPMLEGLMDQVTALLKLPVPFTVAVQAEV